MAARTVLIADDDAAHRRMLGAALESADLACRYAADGEEAVRAADEPLDLVLLDVRMPKLDGIGALRRIHERRPELPVVVVTAHGDVRLAVEAMKLGARDFLEKPIDIEELRSVVADILERPGPPAERPEDGSDEPRTLVGLSDGLARVRETVRRAAGSTATVLVRGESGTGKELVARAIHELSDRRAGPFVAVNCAAVPETLLESELFGHERGAFTGAESRRIGRFEQADGGTLFLDEIGEMLPGLQVRLLRALQERSFERLGGTAPVRVDIRVVAATNRDLVAAIAAGRFREDLYYRLAVVDILLPPLRERREDVLPTAQHLLARLRPGEPPRLGPEAASALALHDWPGNVRELSNVLERALLFAGHGEIRAEHLPPGLRELGEPDPASGAAGDASGVRPGVSLETVERELIAKTLRSLGGNRTRTARALGLSRRALLYKLKRYELR
ncbi:MAG: sigma-54-dependent Fis family transcriptional regulator [Deltaproteobacteria bacterium]|nr:sigma-54-dependent Fis family transcriptional regulator [Deltaproteobacteria bacterium]